METQYIWRVICDICWPWLSIPEIKSIAVLCSSVRSFILPMMERDCFFILDKIKRTITCSPKKAIFKSPPLPLSSITWIKFSEQFNAPIQALPPRLTHLQFPHGSLYNHPLKNIPLTLTHLIFHRHTDFNKKLINLPSSLTHLKLGNGFESPISPVPPSLKQFKIAYHSYSHPIDQYPQSLTNLRIAQQLRFALLPPTLVKLHATRLAGPIDYLPPSLVCLHLTGNNIALSILKHIPLLPSLTDFTLFEFHGYSTTNPTPIISYIPLDSLPSTLRKLYICGMESYVDHLPSSLTHLTLAGFNMPIDHLPSSLTHLTMYSTTFNYPLHHLPNSLVKLFMDSDAYEYDYDHLPPSLVWFNAGNLYDKPLDHLPESLVTLTCGAEFNQPLDYLPISLKELELGMSFVFDHPLDHLPPTLLKLELPFVYSQPLLRLPPTLTTFHIGLYHNHEQLFEYRGPIRLPDSVTDISCPEESTRSQFFSKLRKQQGFPSREDTKKLKQEKRSHQESRTMEQQSKNPAKTSSRKSVKKHANKEASVRNQFDDAVKGKEN